MKKTLLTTALVFALATLGLGTQSVSAAIKPTKIKVVVVVKPPPKPPKPPKAPKTPKPPVHQNAPFDGGVSLLVGAGIAYGVKKAYNNRKKVNG
jgi:hypothetical protein